MPAAKHVENARKPDPINLTPTMNALRLLCLIKQRLAPTSQTTDIVETVRSMGGVHGQLPKTAYLSLFHRVIGFSASKLQQALYEDKTLVRIKSVRQTIYIFPTDTLSTVFRATSRLLEAPSARYLESLGITSEIHDAIVSDILRQLEAAGNSGYGLSTQSLKSGLALPGNLSQLIPLEKARTVLSAVVNHMCDLSLLVRGESASGWKSNLYTYHLMATYLPTVHFGDIGEDEARARIVSDYVQAFGPVMETDICWWTGFTKSAVRESLSVLEADVVPVTMRALEGTFFITKSDRKRLAYLSEPAPSAVLSKQGSMCEGEHCRPLIHFLPVLDSLLMGYKARARLMNPDFEQLVYDRSGNATSTVLVDGKVVGIWDFLSQPQDHICFFLFESVDADVLAMIKSKAAEMGRYIAAMSNDNATDLESLPCCEVIQCFELTPLRQLSAGSFQSPLKPC